MLCITESIVTKKDVYSNLGKYYGGWSGAITGGTGGFALSGGNPFGLIGGIIVGDRIGEGIGEKMATAGLKNPKAAADFNNASDRIGYLAKAYNDPTSAATIGNAGGSLAWIGGRLSGYPLPLPALMFGVGGLGSKAHNAFSEKGAKKLGYGIPGRAAAFAFGPTAGLIPPWKVAKNK